MKTIIFDIETGPLPESELAAMLPPFDPAEVKLGNLKDPEKIAAKLAEAEVNHRRDFFQRAALDPLTGRVLAIGLLFRESGERNILVGDDECDLISAFWESTKGEMGRTNQMVGFNSNSFDLPFLIRRSWKHRLSVPRGIRRGRYWSEQMVDLRESWQLGDRMARGSLGAIARHLGIGDKEGSGADFAIMWQLNREKALDYLRNDLELTAKLADVIGIS